MTSTLGLLGLLVCAALTTASHPEPDCLAPPTAPRYEWLDKFTLKVSWSEPGGLPKSCDVAYLVQESREMSPLCTDSRSIVDTCLSDGSVRCTYTVQTVLRNICDGKRSAPVTLTVNTSESHARLVEDFKCLRYKGQVHCSWKPVDPTQNLTLSYRTCGRNEELWESLRRCERPAGGGRSSCHLSGDILEGDLCMLASSATRWSTFRPPIEFAPPEMSIVEDGSKFQLSLSLSDVGPECICTFEVCYKECNPEICKSFSSSVKKKQSFQVPYNKMCHYEFKARVNGSSNCGNLNSKFSEVQTYGADEPPDATMTAVAVLVPLVLSLCVVLSCYCFRRHRYILCPIIPDPSAIFKEMMMNGNKEAKSSAGNLYTPVPEPTAPLQIDIPPENSLPQPVS